MKTGLVIGAGPAGLMAADVMSQAGLAVTIADQMPSVARKFLMAGKSGLNLTKNEPLENYLAAFGEVSEKLPPILSAFGPAEVMSWADQLGQPLFTGSTGRVFPKAMKASPLLRAWLARLDQQGVSLKTRWCWTGWTDDEVTFDTPNGVATLNPDVTVLALGGASWARLGSDGSWAKHFSDDVAPFAPANMGLNIKWSEHMHRFFGQPVKAVALHSGRHTSRGEFVITPHGIEGGGVYTISRFLRDRAPLTVDLLPDWSDQKLRDAMAKPRGKSSLTNYLRKLLRLDPVRLALLSEFGRPFPEDLTTLIKGLPVKHAGPRPLNEAISTAGGLRFDALDDRLMWQKRPGVFFAGEMLDWEAPTGGYLITACLATGRWAGAAAAKYALRTES